MFRKTYKVVVLAIVLGVLLNACSKRQTVTEEYNTISDLEIGRASCRERVSSPV